MVVALIWIALAFILGRLLKDYSVGGGFMGGGSSRHRSGSRSIPPNTSSSYASSAYYSGSYPEQQQRSSYPAYPPQQEPQQSSNPSSQRYHPQQPQSTPWTSASDARKKKFQRTYSRIADNYKSLDEVTEALAEAGLESSNLIVGVDFTKSNEWTGRNSFDRKSLHHIGSSQNPYEQALSIIGRTLSSFDEDNLIPCFGFGDASTHDQDLFSFYPDERPCNGFEEALSRYREIALNLRLAGPTSFAPVIEMAMTIVEQSGGQYHVLLIVADGQVTRSVDTMSGQLSSQEQKTVDAIVQASHYPLSIILVGVGDGPWDMMREFDDNIPARSFDNFQFVNFTEILLKSVPQARKETEFALSALMEIPAQYRATLELGLLGRTTGKCPERVALPTPSQCYGISSSYPKASQPTSIQKSEPAYPSYSQEPKPVPATSSSSWDSQVCPICLAKPKNMAFGCGHQTCCECGESLEDCPICRTVIQTRIRLY